LTTPKSLKADKAAGGNNFKSRWIMKNQTSEHEEHVLLRSDVIYKFCCMCFTFST
jgi:hypothetical protein